MPLLTATTQAAMPAWVTNTNLLNTTVACAQIGEKMLDFFSVVLYLLLCAF